MRGQVNAGLLLACGAELTLLLKQKYVCRLAEFTSSVKVCIASHGLTCMHGCVCTSISGQCDSGSLISTVHAMRQLSM